MPKYRYKCSRCEITFEKRTSIDERDNQNCPTCDCKATRTLASLLSTTVAGGAGEADIEYAVGRALDAAKSERETHEQKFGKYEEYIPGGGKLSERKVIDDSEIDYIGNVGSHDADEIFDEGP